MSLEITAYKLHFLWLLIKHVSLGTQLGAVMQIVSGEWMLLGWLMILLGQSKKNSKFRIHMLRVRNQKPYSHSGVGMQCVNGGHKG